MILASPLIQEMEIQIKSNILLFLNIFNVKFLMQLLVAKNIQKKKNYFLACSVAFPLFITLIIYCHSNNLCNLFFVLVLGFHFFHVDNMASKKNDLENDYMIQ